MYASAASSALSMGRASAALGTDSAELYDDVQCALELLSHIVTKDFIDYAPQSQAATQQIDILGCVFFGIATVLPLLTPELLQIPSICLAFFGLIGFVLGYIQQDFRITFLWLATGGGISAVVRVRASVPPSVTALVTPAAHGSTDSSRAPVTSGQLAGVTASTARVHAPSHLAGLSLLLRSQICLPDWPCWNRDPLEWLPEPEEEEEVEKKKKKKKEKTAGGEKEGKDKEKKKADKAKAS